MLLYLKLHVRLTQFLKGAEVIQASGSGFFEHQKSLDGIYEDALYFKKSG